MPRTIASSSIPSRSGHILRTISGRVSGGVTATAWWFRARKMLEAHHTTGRLAPRPRQPTQSRPFTVNISPAIGKSHARAIAQQAHLIDMILNMEALPDLRALHEALRKL